MHQGTRRQLHPRHPAGDISTKMVQIMQSSEKQERNLPRS